MNGNKSKESFRDHISTVDEEGKRVWIYPKKPKGPFHRARAWVAVFLLAILFATPFIKINGHPLLMLNILERKFVIFGMAFWPQDFYIFVIATITVVVFVILFTVVFGRVWCGWACPQTIFMEMIFRKIEYLIEGDANEQRKLNAAPMSPKKFFKKFTKHTIFYIVSFILGNIFLAYIIGGDGLIKLVTDPPSKHIAGLSMMILFSLVFYWVYAYFREQVCTIVCPYGRLQGVLLDEKSIVVAYDFKRGEPRGKLSKKDDQSKGDCIDCGQCVDVCPTGIDIRNGTQLECVNCTACIDACNSVMDKIKKPRGLIRYDSYKGIKEGVKFQFNSRILGYSTVLVLLLVILSVLLFTRKPLDATVLRTPGVLYQQTPDGKISNLYNITVINKTFDEKPIDLKLLSPKGEIEVVGGQLVAPEGQSCESSFFVKLDKNELRLTYQPIKIGLYSEGRLIKTLRSSFVGPNQNEAKQ